MHRVLEHPEPCVLPSPTDADARTTRESEEQIREREATELDDVSVLSRRTSRISSITPHSTNWYDPISKVWRRQIRVSVPHVACRDHLANERTFLGYLRSSLALSIIGVIVAQLYTIQHAPSPDPRLGYYVLGKPVASILQASALVMSLVGACRFWRQQNAMVRGNVLVGGWEVLFTGVYTLLLLLGLFAIHVGITVFKSTK